MGGAWPYAVGESCIQSFWWGNLRIKDRLDDLLVGWRIILKCILNIIGICRLNLEGQYGLAAGFCEHGNEFHSLHSLHYNSVTTIRTNECAQWYVVLVNCNVILILIELRSLVVIVTVRNPQNVRYFVTSWELLASQKGLCFMQLDCWRRYFPVVLQLYITHTQYGPYKEFCISCYIRNNSQNLYVSVV